MQRDQLSIKDVISLVVQLIEIESVSGNTIGQRRIHETVMTFVNKHGSGIRIVYDHEVRSPWTLFTSGSPNDDSLLFVCHVDTVPAAQDSLWKNDPFKAYIEEGNLFGRGAVDMKGGLAAAIAALVYGAHLGKPVSVLLTSDEEIGAVGAKLALEALQHSRIGSVVVPEATENLIHIGHRGALWLDVSTEGIEAHGSTPQSGQNAALLLINVLGRADENLPITTDDYLGNETWNLGVLQSGNVPNIVPASAMATIDMRVVSTGEQLREWWESQPEVADVKTILDLPAVTSDLNDPWIRSLKAKQASTGVPYFTDASVISGVLPNTPVVIWGPGSPDQMHSINEALDLKSLHESLHQYREVVASWKGNH